MTSIEEHKKKIKEHLEEIQQAIDAGIEKKPVTIGFNTSAAAIQLLELYLHDLNKIEVGKVIKHDWFKKPDENQKQEPLIERKLAVLFPHKQEVYNLIYNLESARTKLVYGKPSEQVIQDALQDFQKLKELFFKLLSERGVKID